MTELATGATNNGMNPSPQESQVYSSPNPFGQGYASRSQIGDIAVDADEIAKATNPYQPASTASVLANRSSAFVLSVIAFLVGFAPLAGLGLKNYYQFRLAIASLPPGTPVCGNTVIECGALVFVIAPVCGLITLAIAKPFLRPN